MVKDLKTAGLLLVLGAAAAIASNELQGRAVPYLGRERFIPLSSSTPTKPTTGAVSQPAEGPVAADGYILLDDVIQHGDASTGFIVDARKREAYEAGHIRGAFNIPVDAIFDNMHTARDYIPISELVIVYCDGGECESSHTVAGELQAEGYDKILIYKDGWEEFESSRYYESHAVQGEYP